MTRITATKHAGMYQPATGRPILRSAAEAAAYLGCSVAALRRAATSAGVERISGRVVAGMLEVGIAGADRRGYLTYAK